MIVKWARGDYRATAHAHDDGHGRRRHLRRGGTHRHVKVRSPGQALSIGLLHGLAGTGAIVLLLIAALPSRLEAGLALAVFAPMSIVSMAALTATFAWVLTRPIVEPVYRTVLIPALGRSGVFGLWYAGARLAARLVRPQRERQDQQGADGHHAHLAERHPARERDLLRGGRARRRPRRPPARAGRRPRACPR